MSELTARQQEILDFVREHAREHGFWPSIREIQGHFGFRSTNAVAGHLRALKSKGAIDRVPGQARTFKMGGSPAAPALVAFEPDLPGVEEVSDLPVYGSIAAGFAEGIESSGVVDRIQVDLRTARSASRRGTFALRVRGESMIGAGIHDGDVVIVESRSPRDGDIVAALIDGATTLKRYRDRPGGPPYLKAENPDFPELHPISELMVQGVATSVVRKLV